MIDTRKTPEKNSCYKNLLYLTYFNVDWQIVNEARSNWKLGIRDLRRVMKRKNPNDLSLGLQLYSNRMY